jgi:hypothetical protein
MKGVMLLALTKKMPTTMTTMQTETLMRTSRLVTSLDSLMPAAATAPRTRAMPRAPTLTGASSPNRLVGRLRASCR